MYKVLVVDDEPFVREGLRVLIEWEQLGIEIVGEAENGETALALIQSLEPNIVITDIKMPVLDGLGLIREASFLKIDPPEFIILSGHNDFAYAQTAIRFQVNNYILKPINKTEMTSVLGHIIDKLRRAEKEKRQAQLAIQSIPDHIITQLIRGEDSEELLSAADSLMGSRCGEIWYISIACVEDVEFSSVDRCEDTQCPLYDRLKKWSQRRGCILYREDIQRFGLIVSIAMLHPYAGSIHQFVQEALRVLSRSNDFKIFISVGEPVKYIRDLKLSHSSAMKAQKLHFYMDQPAVIDFDALKETVTPLAMEESEWYSGIVEMVEKRNVIECNKKIGQLFDRSKCNRMDPALLKAHLSEMVLKILQIMKTMNADDDMLRNQSQYILNSISNATSLYQIKGALQRFCFQSMEAIQCLHDQKPKGLMVHIENHIKRNYAKDINLKKIAGEHYVHPVYLGHLFKKTFGMSFNHYLQRLRTEEAKKLLIRTDLKIYEIAEKVGYKHTQYFVDQFEKCVGMTPSQYRKREMGGFGKSLYFS